MCIDVSHHVTACAELDPNDKVRALARTLLR